MTRETRTYRGVPSCEVRAEDGQPPVLTGYGAVFGSLSQNLGGFVEVVDPGAFADTLRNDNNVLGAVNHNADWLLATTASGSLALETDDIGLRYSMALDVSDPDAQRAIAKVNAGKLVGSSFSFAVREDDWSTTENGFPLRSLRAVELFELGPVASPAYRATEGEVALRSLAQFIDEPFDSVADAARQNDLATLIARAAGTDIPASDGPRETHPPETPSPVRPKRRATRKNPAARETPADN